jgi:hypothetical protein
MVGDEKEEGGGRGSGKEYMEEVKDVMVWKEAIVPS